MARTYPITNQKYLNVSFVLAAGDAFNFFTLPIKPEELTRTEPSRVSAVNALGGAWVDSFGRGLSTITITGNTGWRDRTGQGDGIAQFTKLRDDFIHHWHKFREMMIEAGLDPADIRLLFIDPLNGSYVADVAPVNFVLRRSKSQPLLLTYNISLTVVNDKAVNPYPYLMEPVIPVNDPEEAIKSLNKSVEDINSIQRSLRGALADIGEFGSKVHDWTDKTFGPVVKVAQEVIQTANDAKAVISAAGQVAVDLASDLSVVGAQAWAAVAAVASLPNSVKSEVMRVKGAMSNLQCVLTNGYQAAASSQDYGSWYGASNCSSSLGGSPVNLSTDNPFDNKEITPVVLKNESATAAIASIKRPADLTLLPDTAAIEIGLRKISAGISVNTKASA